MSFHGFPTEGQTDLHGEIRQRLCGESWQKTDSGDSLNLAQTKTTGSCPVFTLIMPIISNLLNVQKNVGKQTPLYIPFFFFLSQIYITALTNAENIPSIHCCVLWIFTTDQVPERHRKWSRALTAIHGLLWEPERDIQITTRTNTVAGWLRVSGESMGS